MAAEVSSSFDPVSAQTPVRYLDAREVAALVGCGVRSVNKAAADGRLRCVVINGRGDRKFHPSWVAEWRPPMPKKAARGARR